MTLGKNIRNRREELKLSQEYVAEKLGVSRQAVSKWETNQSEPTANNLMKLAEIFEMPLSELVDSYDHNNQQHDFEKKKIKNPNLILRANLIKIAIISQVVFLFNCTSLFYQIQYSDLLNKNLYQGALYITIVLLAISSTWMAINHRYEKDKKQRNINTKIELIYCFIQLLISLMTIHFGMGLVGAVLMIIVCSFYILYINPKYMLRKLTK